jgi:hypothetical protein
MRESRFPGAAAATVRRASSSESLSAFNASALCGRPRKSICPDVLWMSDLAVHFAGLLLKIQALGGSLAPVSIPAFAEMEVRAGRQARAR